jgi:hypothetical protein
MDQMEEHERHHHRNDMANFFLATAERFEHGTIFIHPNPSHIRIASRARNSSIYSGANCEIDTGKTLQKGKLDYT